MISMIERLEYTLKFTPLKGIGTNSIARMYALYQSWGETISKRTVVRDFARLEAAGKIEFVKYAGAAKLFSRPQQDNENLSPQLAWVLIKMRKHIERVCSQALIHQLAPELSAAERIFAEKQRLDPQGRFNRFAHKMAKVSEQLVHSPLPSHVIEPIKEAIYADDNTVLWVFVMNTDKPKALTDITLEVNEHGLVLSGKSIHHPKQRISLSVESIDTVVTEGDRLTPQRAPSLKAA